MARLVKYLLMGILLLSATAAFAQNPSRESQDRLYKVMESQEELSEDDVKLYLQHAEAIYKLRFEPGALDDTVRLIGSWSDKRFAYVTTKMAAGMSLLITPDDSRNNSIPEFARPTSGELRLIQRYQLQLETAMAQARRAYSAD
jgi:hypothetical protein